MLTAFYSKDLICVSYEKVQPDGKEKKIKRGGGKDRNGNAARNRNGAFPQHLLYEAAAGECGKEGVLESSYWKEEKCELWKCMHFYSLTLNSSCPAI